VALCVANLDEAKIFSLWGGWGLIDNRLILFPEWKNAFMGELYDSHHSGSHI
jgi:hypothetical protein